MKTYCAFSMIVSQAICTRLAIKLFVYLGCYEMWQSELYRMCPVGITDFVWLYYENLMSRFFKGTKRIFSHESGRHPKIPIGLSIKVWQRSSLVALLFKQLTAARLQHLLKEPRDGLTPPKVIFYKTRFEAALNRLLGMRVHLFLLDCSNLIKDGGTRKNNGISRSLVI